MAEEQQDDGPCSFDGLSVGAKGDRVVVKRGDDILLSLCPGHAAELGSIIFRGLIDCGLLAVVMSAMAEHGFSKGVVRQEPRTLN